MPAHPFTPPADSASRSTSLTRSAVEDVSGEAVTVYFSRDTVKKLEPAGGTCVNPTAGTARGIDSTGEARGICASSTCEAGGV